MFKVILIGIEGFRPDLLGDAWSQTMPRLKILQDEGSWGTWESDLHPNTTLGWMAALSGQSPENLIRSGMAVNALPKAGSDLADIFECLPKMAQKVGVVSAPKGYPVHSLPGGFWRDASARPEGQAEDAEQLESLKTFYVAEQCDLVYAHLTGFEAIAHTAKPENPQLNSGPVCTYAAQLDQQVWEIFQMLDAETVLIVTSISGYMPNGSAGYFCFAGSDFPVRGEQKAVSALQLAPTILEILRVEIPWSMEMPSILPDLRKGGAIVGGPSQSNGLIRSRLEALGY